jgi:hypothetical protein
MPGLMQPADNVNQIVEIKLTSDQDVTAGAAAGLINFAAEIDHSRHGPPGALVVVTATGSGASVLPASRSYRAAPAGRDRLGLQNFTPLFGPVASAR